MKQSYSIKIEPSKYQGFFIAWIGNRRLLLTKNLTPKKSFFKERLFTDNNIEYRDIDPRHSKLAAAVIKRINEIPIKQGDKVLYLGASHGYTPSFVSDIVGPSGFVFALDFAPRVVRDLYFVCEARNNMAPILANASKPESYTNQVSEVDVIYQDIAQKQQIEILIKNLIFLKPKGYALIAVKSRSIDVTKNPQKIFLECKEKLEKYLRIIDWKTLDPLERDHAFFVCQKMH